MEGINNEDAKGKGKLDEPSSEEILEYLNRFPPNYKFNASQYKFNVELIELYLSRFPAGYKFDPSDDILICDYLVPKIRGERLPINLIHDVSLYSDNPQYFAGSYSPQGPKGWYFFTPRDKKYLNGSRPDRQAGDGYWKATGADKCIYRDGKYVGLRKALVYHKGRPPKGVKTSWIMHEFRTPDPPKIAGPSQQVNAKKVKFKGKKTMLDCAAEKHVSMRLGDSVLCRIYEKKPSTSSHVNDTPLIEVGKEVEPVSGVTDDKVSPPIDGVVNDGNNGGLDDNVGAVYNNPNNVIDHNQVMNMDHTKIERDNNQANAYNNANMYNYSSNGVGVNIQVNGYGDPYNIDQFQVDLYNNTNAGAHNQVSGYNIDYNQANLYDNLDMYRPDANAGPKNEMMASTSYNYNIPAQAGASTVDGFAANQFAASTSFSSGMDANHHSQLEWTAPFDDLDFDLEAALNSSMLMDGNEFRAMMFDGLDDKPGPIEAPAAGTAGVGLPVSRLPPMPLPRAPNQGSQSFV